MAKPTPPLQGWYPGPLSGKLPSVGVGRGMAGALREANGRAVASKAARPSRLYLPILSAGEVARRASPSLKAWGA